MYPPSECALAPFSAAQYSAADILAARKACTAARARLGPTGTTGMPSASATET